MSSEISTKTSSVEASKPLAIFLIIAGITGWIASFLLTLERFHVASDPDATLSCDLATFISCKSVMLSPEAKIFGFPNPLLGLAAFVAPIAVGVAILAGARFANWFWQLFFVGQTLAFAWVLWLANEAIFEIGALCPYCMVAWAAVIPMFWQLLAHGGREGYLPFPAKSIEFFFKAYDWAWLAALLTALAIATVIAVQFWSLWLKFFNLA
ncbi:MAG: vitamin K epoxide reductase family protein [Rhodoluna sp.]|nr:vitamin K epoxide reductase family protein [Rhodoluna sp.]MBP6186175.1 vitamin K epoxide reductase family protein [Rhodoluna sp.]